jgi:hypothetical protein
MHPFNKPLDAVGPEDVQQLVGRAAEAKTVEFKRDLPGASDERVKEFLTDVASFANAAGGLIVYGMLEEDGVAKEVTPLRTDPDAATLRLEQLARSGVAPRIPGLAVRPVRVDGGFVLLLSIPRSWRGPHTIVHRTLGKGTFRFFMRSSAGKQPVDIDELRSLFAFAEELPERLRAFRTERTDKILAGELPVSLHEPSARIVLHVVPVESVRSAGAVLDGSTLRMHTRGLVTPLSGESSELRMNIEGLLRYVPVSAGGKAYAYVQVFRNGTIECVDTFEIEVSAKFGREAARPIPGTALERGLFFEALPSYFRFLRTVEIAPPLVVTLSVVGGRGLAIAGSKGHSDHVIDRDALLLPDVLFEEIVDDGQVIARLMRPALDSLWHAAGWWTGSPHYREGVWQER